MALGLGGCALCRRAQSRIGTVYLIFSYTELLRRPIEQITRQMQDLQQAAAGMRAHPATCSACASAIADGAGHAAAAGPAGRRVRRRHLRLRAPTRRCCAICRSGWSRAQVLGVLGRTGSGKTTLTRLLFRLYDPQRGRDPPGRRGPARRAAWPICARASAWSPRTSSCSTPRVRDNLTFFDRSIPDERILRRAGRAGPGRLVPRAAGRAGHQAGARRRRPLGGPGAAAGLRARVPARPRPGHPRRGLVAARPGHRARRWSTPSTACWPGAPASSSPTGWRRCSAPTTS